MHRAVSAWPPGAGEMVALIRQHDWAATPLGPKEHWPQSLRTAVELMLASAQPVYIAWGEDLISLYNDGYIPIVGEKHPAGLGQPYRQVWAEVAPQFEPEVAALRAGESRYFVDHPMALAGRPGLAMSWFTFSWTPLRDDAGEVAGIYCVATETTERMRSEQWLQQSYRALSDSIDEGFCVIEMIFDEAQRPVDYRVLEVNPAFESQTGLVDTVGKRMRELAPQHEEFWYQTYGRIALTGQPERFEHCAQALGRWYSVYAFRIGDPGAHRLAVLFNDIGERKRAELALKASEERQAFLLELSDALRPLNDAGAIMREATRRLGAALGANRVFYASIDADGDTAHVGSVFADGIAEAAGSYSLTAFAPKLVPEWRAGRTTATRDVDSDPRFTAAERAAYASVAARAAVGAPLVKGGSLVALLGVNHAVPRDWTDGEIDLVSAVAERTWAAVERARAEAELRASEERFRALVTAGTYSIYRMSPDWRVMYQLDSETLADTSEPIENWVDKYILEEDRPTVFAAIDAAIAAKSLFELEHRVRLADGSVGWVISRAVPLLGPDGEIAEWFGAGSDVTERRKAAEQLRESEARHRVELERQVRDRTAELRQSRDLLQATMDASPDMVQVFEAIRDSAGEIVDFNGVLNNHTSESLYGEIRGESLLQRNPGVIEEGIFDAFKRVTETGVPEQAERHYTHEQFDGWFFQSVVKLNDGVATTTKDITAWKDSQTEILRLQQEVADARLRESEERLRQFGEASQDILWIREVEALQWTYLTPAFETIYGLNREEALQGDNYRNWLDMIVDEDRAAAHEYIQRVRQGEHVTFEYRIRRVSDGALRWLRDTDFPITDEAGKVVLVGGIGEDITERKRDEEQLRESEARLRESEQRLSLVFAVLPVGLAVLDRDGATLAANEQMRRYLPTGLVPSRDPARQARWIGFADDGSPVDPADFPSARALRGEEMLEGIEMRYTRDDDVEMWTRVSSATMRDESGAIIGAVAVVVDIDELKRAQEVQRTLVAELQHRVRNILFVMRSVFNRTVEAGGEVESLADHFSGRLDALARTQVVVTQNPRGSADLEDLLREELLSVGAGDGPRLSIEGPDVELSAEAAEALGLAIHELTTNSVKYGALSFPEATLAISWSLNMDYGDRLRLQFIWEEQGVPTIRVNPARQGFGTELITQALPYRLGAETSLEFRGGGVRCVIEFSLPDAESRARTPGEAD